MNWNAVFVTLFGRAGIYWIPDRIAIARFSLSILSIGIISTRQIWQSVFLCNRWASAIDLLSSCVSPSILHEFGTHDSHRSIFQLLTFVCMSLSIGWILCILLSAHFNTFLYARLKCSLLAIFCSWMPEDKTDKSFVWLHCWYCAFCFYFHCCLLFGITMASTGGNVDFSMGAAGSVYDPSTTAPMDSRQFKFNQRIFSVSPAFVNICGFNTLYDLLQTIQENCCAFCQTYIFNMQPCLTTIAVPSRWNATSRWLWRVLHKTVCPRRHTCVTLCLIGI